jgi:prepilin peptidase CpaA
LDEYCERRPPESGRRFHKGWSNPVMLPVLFVAVLILLLVAAAVSDLLTFTIPNILTGSMLGLFVLYVASMAIAGHPLGMNVLSQHLMSGGVGLAFGIGLFALGWVGGGDAKLFAMTCLWLGWSPLYDYAIASSLAGGVLTLMLMLFRRVPLPDRIASRPVVARLSAAKSGVPYGVALAFAGLVLLPETDIVRMIVSQ